MALASGFGLDLETCDAEVFAAVLDELEERGREGRRESLREQARQAFGG